LDLIDLDPDLTPDLIPDLVIDLAMDLTPNLTYFNCLFHSYWAWLRT